MRACIAVCLLLCVVQTTQAQTVRCELNVYRIGYGLAGTCVTTAAAAAEPQTRVDRRRTWPEGPVSVFVPAGPGATMPIPGLFHQAAWHDPFQIDLEPTSSSSVRLVIRTSGATIVADEWKATGPTTVLLAFRLNFAPARSIDTAILESALRRFNSIKQWKRDEDQDCDNDAPDVRGLFCLLNSEVTTAMGRYHNAQPALDLVRAVIRERFGDRYKGHIMVDFNNHAATTAADVQAVMETAASRARRETNVQR